MDLTEIQLEKLKPLLTPKRRLDGRGRPWLDARAVWNGVLWVLRTGAPWHDLPDRYPPYQTCHRRVPPSREERPLPRRPPRFAAGPRLRGQTHPPPGLLPRPLPPAHKTGARLPPPKPRTTQK